MVKHLLENEKITVDELFTRTLGESRSPKQLSPVFHNGFLLLPHSAFCILYTCLLAKLDYQAFDGIRTLDESDPEFCRIKPLC
jgi:hypothetical protein